MLNLLPRKGRQPVLALGFALSVPCALGTITIASAADAATTPAIAELSPADIETPGRQLAVVKSLRGVTLKPFTSNDRAYNSVRKQAAEAGASQIVITWTGDRREEHMGITGVYFVVEALAVQWTDFTPDVARGIMGSLEKRYPIEVDSMLANIKASRDPSCREALLVTLKMSPAAQYLPALTEAYASITGAAAVPELTRLLKYHASDAVRIEAGRQLVSLGARSDVDTAAMTDRSPRVQAALRQLLLH